jgi:hypothetical protein
MPQERNPNGERADIVRDLLQHAIPVNSAAGQSFVTRDEFVATVKTIESKIENSSLRTKQWVLAGCVAILVSGGSGYVSLVSKLDRLTQALPAITERQNTRWPWVQQQQQRDLMQDEVLKKLDRNYQPLPYQAPPP